MSKYEILEEIGKGAFGKAYKGTYKGQIVVIKYISKSQADKDTFEAESLHSRHVLHMYDSFEDEDRYAIITEYCPYKTLDKVMLELRNNNKFLSLFGVLKYFCDMLEGLTHLSANNIMHRDIKPENIFITPENVCILGDFGLAAVKDEKIDVAGNLLYQSPETFLKSEYHKNSEIWSIGLILYELATNTEVKSFLRNNKERLEEMLKTKDYLPKKYPPHLEPIQKIVDRCLELNPEKRATIDELKNLPIIKKHMKEAGDDLFVNDTIDDYEVDDELEKLSHRKPDKLLVEKKTIISLFNKASRMNLSQRNEWKLFELINSISINIGRTLLYDEHDENPHYIYIKNEYYDELLNIILAIYKFLLKKNFKSEADGIYNGISEEKNVKRDFIDRMKKIGDRIMKKKNLGKNNK